MKTVLLPNQYKYTVKLPYNDDTKQAITELRKQAKGKFKIRSITIPLYIDIITDQKISGLVI